MENELKRDINVVFLKIIEKDKDLQQNFHYNYNKKKIIKNCDNGPR